MYRRQLLAAAGRLVVAAALTSCAADGGRQGASPQGGGTPTRPENSAALTADPRAGTPERLPEPGTHHVGDDALLYVPASAPPTQPVPLVVTLHGAGGDAEAGLALLRGLADERGLVLLAPAAAGSTWDAVRGQYGPDVDAIDAALHQVLDDVPADPDRLAVAGFSDGASYAVGLGLANGELFSHVIAFSPGFVPPAPRSGDPAVFVSHGVGDEVLPVDRTSRRIVPALRDDGYDVTYREFDGGHVLPPEVASEAIDWLGVESR